MTLDGRMGDGRHHPTGPEIVVVGDSRGRWGTAWSEEAMMFVGHRTREQLTKESPRRCRKADNVRGHPAVLPPTAAPAVAIGAFATGARPIGVASVLALASLANAFAVVALWRVAIKHLHIENLRIREAEIGDLTVRRLKVVEQD